MSTDLSVPISTLRKVVAPQFGLALADGLNDAWKAGLDPIIYETLRTDDRQKWLYRKGRNAAGGIVDPSAVVTNAPDGRNSWHFFGLAADVISKRHGWDDPDFFAALAPYLKAHGLAWGGDWSMRDKPHYQPANLKVSPSNIARRLYQSGGNPAVWLEVGAA